MAPNRLRGHRSVGGDCRLTITMPHTRLTWEGHNWRRDGEREGGRGKKEREGGGRQGEREREREREGGGRG